MDERQITFFVDTKAKAAALKKLFKVRNLDPNTILDYHSLKTTCPVISHRNRGVMIALERYGSGEDIRFATDSLVAIGYTSKSMNEVL